VPRIVQANLRHIETADGALPQSAECRWVVWLTRLGTDDVAPICVCLAKRELLDGLPVLRRGQFSQQSIWYGKDATGIGA